MNAGAGRWGKDLTPERHKEICGIMEVFHISIWWSLHDYVLKLIEQDIKMGELS